MSQWDILQQLGMEASQQSVISKDVAWIAEQWKQSTIRDWDAAKGKELAALDLVERAAPQHLRELTPRLGGVAPHLGRARGMVGATRLPAGDELRVARYARRQPRLRRELPPGTALWLGGSFCAVRRRRLPEGVRVVSSHAELVRALAELTPAW